MAATNKTDWFWSDWAGDQAVRRLTTAERGVWIDLLALAAVGKPAGYVCDAKGRPVKLEEIGRFTNCQDLRLLAELIDGIVEKGAASRDRAGRLFNRRMVRDAELSTKRARAANQRWGPKPKPGKRNPDLHVQKPMQNQERRGASTDPPLEKTEVENPSAEPRARAPAPGCTISDAAFTLADQVAAALGLDPDDPRRVGFPGFAQGWINRGFDPVLCAATVVETAARHPGKPLGYYAAAIATAHASAAAAPPPVKWTNIVPMEASRVQATARHPGGAYGASKDRFRDAHAGLKAAIADHDQRDEGGGPPPELLPAPRRERP